MFCLSAIASVLYALLYARQDRSQIITTSSFGLMQCFDLIAEVHDRTLSVEVAPCRSIHDCNFIAVGTSSGIRLT